jgi:outer membrane biosynthesis protein TonB
VVAVVAVVAVGVFVFAPGSEDRVPQVQSPPVAPENQQAVDVSPPAEAPVEIIPEVKKVEPAAPVELPERPEKPIEPDPPPEKKATPEPTPAPVPVKETPAPEPKPVVPPPAVEAAPSPPVPTPAAGPGKLSVNSKPPSTVTIGGRSLGKWVRNVSLDAGTHRVVLRTDSGQSKVLSVDIKSGKPTVLCWSFELNAVCTPPKK